MSIISHKVVKLLRQNIVKKNCQNVVKFCCQNVVKKCKWFVKFLCQWCVKFLCHKVQKTHIKKLSTKNATSKILWHKNLKMLIFYVKIRVFKKNAKKNNKMSFWHISISWQWKNLYNIRLRLFIRSAESGVQSDKKNIYLSFWAEQNISAYEESQQYNNNVEMLPRIWESKGQHDTKNVIQKLLSFWPYRIL